jgi:hypothetical protein
MYRILALFPKSDKLTNLLLLDTEGDLYLSDVPTEQEVSWDPEPVWMIWITEKILPVVGIEPQSPFSQSVPVTRYY